MEHLYERRLVLAVQAHGYAERTARMQELIREGLRTTLDHAADRSGLDRSSWHAVDGGLAVLPAGVSESMVIDRFVRQLHISIREHNRLVTAEGRLRLRLAVHFGQIGGNPEAGFDGPAAVVTRALVGCAAALDVLDTTTAELVLVVSDLVYTDTIAGQLTSFEAGELRQVEVRGKAAWLWTPGTPRSVVSTDIRSGTGPRSVTDVFTSSRIDMRGGQIAGRDIHNHGAQE